MASIRKVGEKWLAEVCVNNTRKSKRFATKAAARSWALDAEDLLSRSAAHVDVCAHATLGDVFLRYADEVSEHKKGAQWEIVRLKMFGRDEVSAVPVIELRREHFEAWRDRRLLSVAAASVNRELNLISHCLTQARRWRLMEHNPLTDLKRPKNPPHRDRRIFEHEKLALLIALNYADEYPVVQQQQRVAVAFLFAIETAMRAGEICALEPRFIDLAERTAHLPDTKNGLPRTVPLSRAAVALLEKLQPWPEDGGVFGLASGVLSSLFKRGTERAGIDGLTFHDTRHEAITRLAKKLDVLQLARMVGHRDIKQLMTYYNATAAEIALQLD
jgi:integrase